MSLFQKIILLVLLSFLVLLFSLPLLRSGLTYNYGIGYWGPTGHDLIWHQSLINHITSPFKIPIPSFSGELLTNYHPFYNILISSIHQISSIPINILIFQVFPLISSAIYIYLSFVIGKILSKHNSGGYFLALINVTTSSAGFIYTFLTSNKFGGESIFWSMQSASIQTNPPLVLSLIFIQLLIIFIIKKKSNVLIILLLALLPITKAYGGITGYFLWGFYSLFSLKLNNKKPITYLLISLPISYFFFTLYNPSPKSLFEFNPLWFIDQMFNSPDKIYFPRLASALYNLKLAHSFKVVPIYLFGITIFIIGNYFWRLLGMFYFLKNKTSFTYNLLLTALLLLIIPLIFTQSGTAWNTIQFLYYSLFLFNILFALYLVNLKNKIQKSILIFFFIFTSFLTNLDTYQGYLGNPPPATIPSSEIKALKFLQSLPSGTVLTYPFNSHIQDNFKTTPIPLYAYITSSYIPAFTHHTTYISDEMNLNNSGYNWQSRLDQSLQFFKQENKFQDRGFLINNSIDYIYLTGYQNDRTNLDNPLLSLQKLYDNGHTLIFKVNR